MTTRQPVIRPMMLALAVLCAAAGLARWGTARSAAAPVPVVSPSQEAQTREVRVVARRYSYSPDRIEVQEGDLVKVTLETEDVPHSFTIDDPYRIAKRATPGHPVVFEFRADAAGTFPYYCNLTAEDGCRKMRGDLVVRPKR
jgi:heme/copper-type cytochrome/quinol oxidase subunit 2